VIEEHVHATSIAAGPHIGGVDSGPLPPLPIGSLGHGRCMLVPLAELPQRMLKEAAVDVPARPRQSNGPGGWLFASACSARGLVCVAHLAGVAWLDERFFVFGVTRLDRPAALELGIHFGAQQNHDVRDP
jgi:hypothetical protein